MDLWLVSIGIFCVASWLSAVNMLATILGERRAGMTWTRLPMTVWAWLVTSILSLLVFAVLLAAVVLLFSDRHFGSSFFIPYGRSDRWTCRGSRRRLAAAVAASVLVLRAPGGLHCRAAGDGAGHFPFGQLHPAARSRLPHDGGDAGCDRPAGTRGVGTPHVRERHESLCRNGVCADDDGDCRSQHG